ncbi:MAG: hypothetical protein ACJ79K_16985 [Gemmatimonadaceae bacterium]
MTTLARRTIHTGLALALPALAACASYDVSVTGPDPHPHTTPVAVSFCSENPPQWVAFQDGDGAWTPVLPTVAGQFAVFRHDFASNRGAVATGRRFASGFTSLSVQYGALDELSIAGEPRTDLCVAPELHTLIGTVAGIDTNEVAVVNDGRSTREATTRSEGGDFTLRFVPAGPQELFATRLTDTGNDLVLTGYILRHALELPDGATIPVLDFSSAEVIHPVSPILTLTGFGTDGAISRVGFRTAHSDNVVTFGNASVLAKDRIYYALPADRLAAGDLQFLSATTNMSNTSNVVRSVTTYFRAPVDRTMAFPVPPHVPQLSVIATTPSARLRARFDAQAEYDRQTSVHFQQGQNVVSVGMTPGYAALNPDGYDLVLPELGALAGFDARWALRSGVATIWQITRIGGTLGLAPGVVPADGDTRVIGTDGGFITP